MGKVKYRLEEAGIDGEEICNFVECVGKDAFPCGSCFFGEYREEYKSITKEQAIIAIDKANKSTSEDETENKVPSVKEEPLEVNKTKYQRQFFGVDGDNNPTMLFTDVYGVLDAFKVRDSAIDHALKKLLAGGSRGAKDKIQDWKEAVQSIECAIKLEEIKQKVKED